MAMRTATCRVCGKQFVPCNKSSASLGAFNYRSIACSPECGAEYLRRVQEARKKPEQKESAELAEQISIEETVSADVNVTGEVPDVDEKDIDIFDNIPKAIRPKRNKQETNKND